MMVVFQRESWDPTLQEDQDLTLKGDMKLDPTLKLVMELDPTLMGGMDPVVTTQLAGPIQTREVITWDAGKC